YEMALLSSSTLTKSEAMETLDKGKNFLESPIFKIIVIVLIALIVVMIVVTIILSRRNKKRKRYGKGRYSR
ncbi:MAG: hypothetical protein IKB44_02470, partial [Clostridia bacterium]|nr:hypothetical protein [Clostridia bacterium]